MNGSHSIAACLASGCALAALMVGVSIGPDFAFADQDGSGGTSVFVMMEYVDEGKPPEVLKGDVEQTVDAAPEAPSAAKRPSAQPTGQATSDSAPNRALPKTGDGILALACASALAVAACLSGLLARSMMRRRNRCEDIR